MINWAHWHNEPYLVGGLVFLGWCYALLAGPWSHRTHELPSPGQRACFYSALCVFYLAVGSPLDQIGEQFLFSAHMLQHILLTMLAAPLMLAGLPVGWADAVLASAPLRRCAAIVFHPCVAPVLYAVVVGIWHFPALYDLALRDKLVHVLEHLSFFGVALIFWWPICGPSRLVPPLKPGAHILYWVAMMILSTPLFAYLTFSRDILYPTYEFAPRITHLSAKEDQVLAGAGMKLVGVAVALVASGIAFWRWYQADAAESAGSGPLDSGAGS